MSYKKYMRDRHSQIVDTAILERKISKETDEEVKKELIKEKEELERNTPDKRTKLNYGI